MRVLTGSRAARALAEHTQNLHANHLLACGLVLAWAAPHAPPWFTDAAHQLATIRTFRKALGDKLETATLLLPDDGSIILIADIIRNAAYRDAIAAFTQLQAKYGVTAEQGVFQAHDLSVSLSEFLQACARTQARVALPVVFIPQQPPPQPFAKPEIPPEEYKRLLEDLFVQQLDAPQSTPHAPAVAMPTSHIRTARTEIPKPLALLVEDDTAVRMLAAQLLRAAGVQVATAASGAEALRLYLNNDARTLPDLVLLDIELPDISGLDVLDILQRHAHRHANARPGGLYAAMLTASAAAAHVVQARARNARDYIVKPFNQKRIFDCVNRYQLYRGIKE